MTASTPHRHPTSSVRTRSATFVVALMAVLITAGCVEATDELELELEDDISLRPALPQDPLSGLWKGYTPSNVDSPSMDHRTHVSWEYVAHPDPDGIYARYKYVNLPGDPTCYSELIPVSSEDGLHVFEDHTITGFPCVNGTVTLEEMGDQLYFQWIRLDGTIENEGTLSR